MAVKTFLHAISLDALEALRARSDSALEARLDSAWFGAKVIADSEKAPDRVLLRALLHGGDLYGDLDDETALRMDKMVMLLVERELPASPLPFAPMRDDVQLLVRALRAAGEEAIATHCDALANGRRLGSDGRPIDVPHYGYLRRAELETLAARSANLLSDKSAGLLGRLLGGRSKLPPEQRSLMEAISAAARKITDQGKDLFSVNRDPSSRWDVA